MKSVFKSDKGKGKEISQKVNPPEFRQLGIIIVEEFKKTLSDNEIRALATSKVASPALHVSTIPLTKRLISHRAYRCFWSWRPI